MLISPAMAQVAGAASGGFGGLEGLMPFVLIAVVFYFLLIRPQQKRQKDHKSMVANLRRGDRIVTAGGIIGTVSKVPSDTELQVEIAEGVKVRIARSTVSEILIKPGSAGGGKGGDSGGGQTQAPGGLLGGLAGLLGRGKKSN